MSATYPECPRCVEARKRCAALCATHGLRPSRVIDHGVEWCADQSIETWPATFNHPRVYVQVRDRDLVPFHDVSNVTEYGLTQRLSTPVRVF